MQNESWVRSSYSTVNGDCIEAACRKSAHSSCDCAEVAWHTPGSSVNGGNCVEAGRGSCGYVHVRDTKDRDGPVLEFSPGAWMEFLEDLK